MTRSLATQYMDTEIRINVVVPCTMATELSTGVAMPEDLETVRIQRTGGLRPPSRPEEVAALIAFLASLSASAVHGAILDADGEVTAG
jgi:NAD(P)-dependent dehydrogenase (short-subunit alcohol dehydrogenase family)